jgi:hypothetical protein
MAILLFVSFLVMVRKLLLLFQNLEPSPFAFQAINVAMLLFYHQVVHVLALFVPS